MTAPLVSICVPTYNRADALRGSLPEIRRQDYEPLEILISDNASTDETEAICRQAAAEDPRIRYLRQPRNLGNYGNHNALMDASRGAYLCFFHDHDERVRRLVRTYLDFFDAHPRVGVVCSDWELIDREGRWLGDRRYPVREVTPGLDYIEESIRTGRTSIGIPGAMVRREALGSIRFDEAGHLGFGDFILWFQVAERWDVGHLPGCLWRWTQEPGAQSARTIVSLTTDYEENVARYCAGHLTRWPDHGPLVARWRRLARQYLFWALAYEIGLYYRRTGRDRQGVSRTPTLFELLGYALGRDQFEDALRQLRGYATGPVQRAASLGIRALVATGRTEPLAWATEHHGAMRQILRLR